MLKTLRSYTIVKNYSFSLVRNIANFAEKMEQAVEERLEVVKEKNLQNFKIKKERYNGKIRRRDWVEETEEVKKARIEAQGVGDKIKRKKCLILLGYSGVDFSGMQRNTGVATIEEELLKSMLKNKWISEDGFASPQTAFFQRAARTDKGVSAARQVVSIKLPDNVSIEDINKDLPESIRVFAVKRVTKGFNSKTTCDARTYSYTLPTYMFTKEGEEFQDTSFRLSSERFEELNKTLALYVGTKNFHNYTIKKLPNDPSVKRYIMSFECQQPFVPDNTEVEFARLRITGQSFMLHQIRRMVGMVIAILRGHTDQEFMGKTFGTDRYLIPQAPGLGLVLDNVHYTRYNERYGSDGVHEKLMWQDEEEVVEDFFRRKIMPTIIDTELKETPMKTWVKRRIIGHSFEYSEKSEDALEDAEKEDNNGYESD